MKSSATPPSPLKTIVLWILAIGTVAVLINYGLGLLFSRDDTPELIPFQNLYLSFQHPFLTSESIIANDDNPGRVGRMFSNGILVLLGWGLFLAILRIIPLTRVISVHVSKTTILVIVLIFIRAAFFPPIKTVFDQEKKQLRITRYHLFFLTAHERVIPYSEVTGFDYEFAHVTGFSTIQAAGVLELYVTTKDQRFFIGENRIDTHAVQSLDWKTQAEEKFKGTATKAVEVLQGLIVE